MSLARAADRRQALIANVEEDSLDVVMVSEGVPQIIRTLPFPPDVPVDGRGSYAGRVLSQTKSYFGSQISTAPLDGNTPLFLAGSGAWDPSLREQIEESVDSPIEEFAPPLEYPPHLPTSEYAVNLGLALRGSPRLAPREEDKDRGTQPLLINLVPPTGSRIRTSRELGTGLVGMAAGLAAIFLLFGQVADAAEETDRLRDQFTPIEQEVTTRRAELARLSTIEAAIAEFHNLTEPWGQVTETLAFVQASVGEGITLTRVGVLPKNVEISASADRVDQAIDFVETLRSAGWQVQYPKPTTKIEATINPTALPDK